jgi:sugar lactone lactonase YvrE
MVKVHDSASCGGMAIHPVSMLIYVTLFVFTSTPSYHLYSVDFNAVPQPTVQLAFKSYRLMSAIAVNASDPSAAMAFIGDYTYIYTWNTSGSQSLQQWNTGMQAPVTGKQATSTKFSYPDGFAFDAAGNMLLSELGACRVWLVDAVTGKLKQVAGTECALDGSVPPKFDSTDPLQTQIDAVGSVAFGPGGRTAFIADTNNHRILKVVLECVGA